MDRLSFYKELYFKEDERKIGINNSISIPITIITALSAWLFYFYQDRAGPLTTQSALLKICFGLSVGTLLLSILLIVSALFWPALRNKFPFLTSRYDYEYIPPAKVLEDWYQKEVQFRKEDAAYSLKAISDSDGEFEKMLTASLVAASTHNRRLNESKADRLSLGRFFLIISLFLNFLLFIISISNKPLPDKIQRIEIVNVSALKDSTISYILKNLRLNKKDTCNFNKPIKINKHGHKCTRSGKRGITGKSSAKT